MFCPSDIQVLTKSVGRYEIEREEDFWSGIRKGSARLFERRMTFPKDTYCRNVWGFLSIMSSLSDVFPNLTRSETYLGFEFFCSVRGVARNSIQSRIQA